MSKTLIEIASEIVQTQVSLVPMNANDIASSLRQVFSTLQELQRAESTGTDAIETPGEGAGQELKPALSPEDSIQNDKVICLECGAEMRQLTQKHLSSHDLSPREYKKKYGFTLKTPLSAKALTKARSKAARKRGLPENLKKFLESRRKAKVEAKPAPERTDPSTERARKIRRRFSPKTI